MHLLCVYMEWYEASRKREREKDYVAAHITRRYVKNIMVGHFELNSFLLFVFIFVLCGPLNYFSGTNKKKETFWRNKWWNVTFVCEKSFSLSLLIFLSKLTKFSPILFFIKLNSSWKPPHVIKFTFISHWWLANLFLCQNLNR